MGMGERLRECRVNADLKQAEAAEKLNIAFSTLSGYERGHRKPEPEIIVQMSRLNSVTTDYLLGVDDEVEDLPVLARRLRIARENSGFNQTEVDDMFGLNNKTLSGYERGVSEPDTRTLMLLSRAYSVTVDWLVGQNITYDDAKKLYAIAELLYGRKI